MKPCLLIFITFYFNSIVYAENIIHIGNFSKQDSRDITPKGWEPLNFSSIENQTAYFLTQDSGKTIFKAVSHNSASGYVHKLSIDPKQFPILTWEWKIDNLLKEADITQKSGDDYPARLYITFDYDKERLSAFESFKIEFYKSLHGVYPPLAVLNYVWDNKKPIGFTTANAYTNRVQMIVSQTGESKVGQWVKQEVNIYEDYKKVFGEAPLKITSVAIMTDTDNTASSATAYYGDIILKKIKIE